MISFISVLKPTRRSVSIDQELYHRPMTNGQSQLIGMVKQ